MAKSYLKMSDDYKNQTDAQIIREALENNSDFFKYNLNNIQVAISMRNFLYVDGGQWVSADVADRKLRAKTCETLNVTEPIIRKLISEERASDPQCIVIPMDENIPTKLIKLKTGLHESIVYESNAKMVFSKCYADMIEAGYGQINVVTRPETPTSFNMVQRYEAPEDVLYSYWDATDPHPNKINGDYAGNYFFMAKKTAMMTYDVDRIESIELPNYWGTNFYTMLRKDVIVLLRHYRRCYGTITMVKLEGGAEMPYKIYREVEKEIKLNYEKQLAEYRIVVYQKRQEMEEKGFSEEQINLALTRIPEPEMPEIPRILKKKKFTDYFIEQLILSADKVLKREILPIKSIPQLYAGGNDKKFLGITITQPYAANAVTPQRLINYITSEQIDNIGRSFGLRVIAHEDSIEGKEGEYKRPSISNLLTYKGTETDGIVPPKFEYISGVDMNLMAVLEEQQQNIKAVLGRYNENLGQESNAYGYEAILARQLNGDIGSGIYPENLSNVIAEAAKIQFEWMPFTYDTQRGILVKDSEGETKFVTINRPTGEEDEYGNLVLENDMRKGSFTIEVHGGLSFQTQRLAGMQFLKEIMQGDDTLKHDLMDIYIGLSPFPFKNEAIRRLKDTGYINPEVVAEEEGKPAPKPKPNPLEELAKLKIMGEIKQLQAQEFKSKMDAIQSLVKLKTDLAQMKNDEVKAEIQLMSDTVEAYASIIQSEAEANDKSINASVDLMQQILDKEIKELEEDNVLSNE
jgi:hypothetical protein